MNKYSPELQAPFIRKKIFSKLTKSNSGCIGISAPSCSGKSTLVQSYLDSIDCTNIWFNLRPEDNHPRIFLVNLIQSIPAPIRKEIYPPTSYTELNYEAFIQYVLSKVILHSDKPVYLILDDFGVLDKQKLTYHIARNVIKGMQTKVKTFVIETSSSPTDWLLELIEQPLILNWNDFRFDKNEVAEFVRYKGIKSLSTEEINNIYRRSNGWISEILLELSLETGLSDLNISGSEYITDEYVNTNLNRIMRSLGERDDLLNLSMLALTEKFDLGMVNNLDRKEARAIAKTIINQSLFVSKIQDSSNFVFHQAFKKQLLLLLSENNKDKFFLPYTTSAIDIALKKNDIATAIALALIAEDWSTVIKLVLENAEQFIGENKQDLVCGWIEGIPEELSKKNGWLLYWYASGKLSMEDKAAYPLFTQAYSIFKENRDVQGQILSWCNIIAAIASEWADFSRLDNWIDVYYQEIANTQMAPVIAVKTKVSLFTALLFRSSNLDDLHSLAEFIKNIISEISDETAMAQLVYLLYLYYAWFIGDADKVKFVCDAVKLRLSQTNNTYIAILWCTINANLARLEGNHESVKSYANKGLMLATQTGIHKFTFFLLQSLSISYLDEGDVKNASATIEKLSASSETDNYMFLAYYYDVISKISLTDKNAKLALEYSTLAVKYADMSGLDIGSGLSRLSLIHALYMNQSDINGTVNELNEIIKKTGSFSLNYFLKTLLISYRIKGQKLSEESILLLQEAMALGKSSAFVVHAVLSQNDLSVIYNTALHLGIEADYVKTAIEKRGLKPVAASKYYDDWAWPVKLHLFDSFEISLNGKKIEFGGKAQKKPIELILTLACASSGISSEKLVELLWADDDFSKKSYQTLHTTIHRAKKLLSHPDAILSQDGQFEINSTVCWVDTRSMEKGLKKHNKLLEDSGNSASEIVESITHIVDKFSGGLAGFTETNSLIEHYGEYIKNKFIESIILTVKFFENKMEYQLLLQIYSRLQSKFELTELLYQGLVRVYLALGDKKMALNAYNQCIKMLEQDGIEEASTATRQLFEKITKN
ncbi:MAG: hypothetical protein OEY96_03360 [Gammaproteobacteria bacterium]|nr:hypothetical protein [Gammaproteobacteria bacterium]